MASQSIKKLQAKLEAASKRASRMARATRDGHTVEPLVQGAVGLGYGFLEGRGTHLPTVLGLPPALTFGAAALAVAAYSRGKTAEYASAASGALLAIGAAAKGRQLGADARGAAPTKGDGNFIGYELPEDNEVLGYDLNTQSSNNTSL